MKTYDTISVSSFFFNLLVSTFLFICCFSMVSASTSGEAYFDYPYSLCGPPGSSATQSLAQGETSYLCINFNGKTKSIFTVTVDQFAAISVSGSNTALPTGSGFIRQGEGHVDVITTSSNTSDSRTFFQVFDVAALGAFSPYPRIYKKATYTVGITGDLIANIVTFPVYTVIITLEKGVISSISYDDGCFFCAENSATCGFNSINANSSFEIGVESLRGCSKSLSECTAPSSTTTTTNTVTSSSVSSSNLTNSTNVTMTSTSNTVAGNSTFPSNTCDLKVFVVWQGTDRKGNYCTSVNKRFSRYRQFNVATAYQSALNLQAQGLDIAKSAINVAQSIPGQIGINGNDEVGRRLRGDKESKELEETVDDSMEV